jgi:hypothetical protein
MYQDVNELLEVQSLTGNFEHPWETLVFTCSKRQAHKVLNKLSHLWGSYELTRSTLKVEVFKLPVNTKVVGIPYTISNKERTYREALKQRQHYAAKFAV